MLRLLLALSLAASLGSLAAAPAAAQADGPIATGPVHFDANAIQPDPAVRRGVLANGLRYAVMQNAKPKGGVSLRLGVDVGSFEETDDERGVAHFVEHMVFNGSKNFPEGEVMKAFQPLGVGFGRDQNAGTDLFSTSYGLDLHDTAAGPLDLSLRWLRDVADGALFAPAAVDRERGVIMAEREMDLGPMEASQEAMQRFHGAGLRSTDRDPIGTVESLKSVNSAKLKAFYQRWYRPDNAVVVMVGDLPVEVLEQKVRDTFSTWRAEGPAASRAPRGKPNSARGLDTLVLSETNVPTMVSACRARPADPMQPDDVAALRRTAAGAIWRKVMEGRLQRLATGSDPAFLGASAVTIDQGREEAATCLSVLPINDRWDEGLQAASAELRRLAAEGPTDHEFETAVEAIRSKYRGAVGAAPSRDSVSLAQGLVQSGLTGRVFASPREAFRAYDAAVEDLTPQDIKLALARDWSGEGPLLSMIGPTPPTAERLAAAWRASEAAPVLAKYTDPPIAKWLYQSFGKAGVVAKREAISEGDFVRVTFKNGVILNFKHTDLASEEVVADVRFGHGMHDIPDGQGFAAQMAAAAFKSGGLGRESIEDINTFLPPDAWDATMIIASDAFLLRGRSNIASIEEQIYVLAAYMSDPGFRPAIDARLPATMQANYRLYRTSPDLVLSIALTDAFAPTGANALPTEAAAMAIRSKDFERLLKPAIVNSPMEVSIVGDVDEKAAIALVAATFGAMPPRPELKPASVTHSFLRFPAHPPATIRTTHEGSPEKAVVSVVWPLYVAEPARRHEEMALGMVAEIFENGLLQRVREELGKTYAPQASTDMPDAADQGVLTATIEAYPGDVDTVVAETLKVAASLAAGNITAAEFDAAKQPLLSKMTAEERSNMWWLDVLSGSSTDPKRAPDIMSTRSVTASVTLADVKKAAADWLSKKPIVAIAVPKTPVGVTAQAGK